MMKRKAALFTLFLMVCSMFSLTSVFAESIGTAKEDQAAIFEEPEALVINEIPDWSDDVDISGEREAESAFGDAAGIIEEAEVGELIPEDQDMIIISSSVKAASAASEDEDDDD